VTPVERRGALEAIAADVRACTRCRLHETRTLAVPGEGSPDTEVVLVGEGPGRNEDLEGRPFVGRAGGMLVRLLAALGWQREDVFITNVVKCRPPGNRDPEPDEIAACAPFLRRQLAVLDPAVVVTLGRYSLGMFMPDLRIGQAHGTSRAVDPATGARDALAFAMYHPAAALRAAALERTSFEDIARLPGVLLEARARREPSRDPSQAPAPASSDGMLAPALASVPASTSSPTATEPAPDGAVAQLTLF
jgi:uracil-DNA glycosylase